MLYQPLVSEDLKVSLGPVLADVVCVLWVRFEGDLRGAHGTSNVESEDKDPQVVLAVHLFLSCIEFLSFWDPVRAGEAPHGERGHQPDRVLYRPLEPGLVSFLNFARIKVRREILVQDLALRPTLYMRVYVSGELGVLGDGPPAKGLCLGEETAAADGNERLTF